MTKNPRMRQTKAELMEMVERQKDVTQTLVKVHNNLYKEHEAQSKKLNQVTLYLETRTEELESLQKKFNKLENDYRCDETHIRNLEKQLGELSGKNEMLRALVPESIFKRGKS